MTQSHTPTPYEAYGVGTKFNNGNGPDFNVGQHADKVAQAYESAQENLRAIESAINRKNQTINELVAALRAIINTNPVADHVLDIHALEIRNIARAALAASEKE